MSEQSQDEIIDGTLPDFDIEFEQKPRSPACLILTLLATPILLACSLALLAGLILFSLQIINARP